MLKLYVHGWTTLATEDEVRRRFEGLPGIKRIVRLALNSKRFAHVDLEVEGKPEDVLAKLQAVYKNAKWKGGPLQFEPSRPEFLERLKQEKQRFMDLESRNGSDESSTSGQGTTLADIERLGGLRIRMKKSVSGKRKNKKASLVVFNDDAEDDDGYNYSWDVQDALADRNASKRQRLSQPIRLPLSQDPAYCCTAGDAGPTTTICRPSETQESTNTLAAVVAPTKMIVPEVKPPAPSKADLSLPQNKGNGDDDEFPTLEIQTMLAAKQALGEGEEDLSTLAKFVEANKPPVAKPKKNSSKSLLGMWFAQNPVQVTVEDSA